MIIGRAGRNLTPDQAGAYIAGYTIFNDWSARDLQIEEMKLGLGICKGKDFANTLGPWIVTPDELEPFRSGDRLDLDLRARVNDRELGDDTLANMAWSFEELIAYASRGAWIRPGDVLGLGHLRLGLPARAAWSPRPRRVPSAGGRRHGDAVGAGDRQLTNTIVAGRGAGAAAGGPPRSSAGPRTRHENRLPRPRAPARLPEGARTLPLPPTDLGGLEASMERYEIDAAVDLGRAARRVHRRRRRAAAVARLANDGIAEIVRDAAAPIRRAGHAAAARTSMRRSLNWTAASTTCRSTA